MALDEPTDADKKFVQDGYTIVVDPRVADLAGDITLDKHFWGGLNVTTSKGRF